MKVQLTVEWGYELHSISLRPELWMRIQSGEAMNLKGDGYSYEGFEFQDYWQFFGQGREEVVVTYTAVNGDVMDEGDGFAGGLCDVLVDEIDDDE